MFLFLPFENENRSRFQLLFARAMTHRSIVKSVGLDKLAQEVGFVGSNGAIGELKSYDCTLIFPFDVLLTSPFLLAFLLTSSASNPSSLKTVTGTFSSLFVPMFPSHEKIDLSIVHETNGQLPPQRQIEDLSTPPSLPLLDY